MNNVVIRIIIIMMFMLPSFLEAACYDRVQLDVRVGAGGIEFCDLNKTLSSIATTPIPVGFNPDSTNCDGGTWTDAGGCINVMTFCCNTNVTSYEHDNHQLTVLTGIPFGQEKAAAQLQFDSFLAAPNTGCATGFTQIGFMGGYAFDSELTSSNSVNVYLSSWKQTLCSTTGSGQIIPVSQLPSGSGGSGGLTQAQTAAAVATGVTAIDTQLQTLNTKIDSTNQLLTSINSKPAPAGSGGLTQAQTTQAVQDAVNNVVGTTPASLGMTSYTKPTAYTNAEFASFGSFNFGSRINTFVTDIKATPLVSSFSLAGLANVPAGSSSMPVSFGRFGNVNFDLATYSATYNYIKGFLLLLGSYLAVRIVVLKR